MIEEKEGQAPGATAASPKAKNEFVDFMRRTFVSALDHYATKVSDRDSEGAQQSKPVRKIAEHWLRLEEEEKLRFFDKVIGVAEVAIAATPVAIASLRERRRKKEAKKSAKKSTPAKSTVAETKPKKKKVAKKPAKKKKSAGE